jgi:hypothetical protein
MRAPEWSYKRSYILAIRNISNTADFIRVWDDGVTVEIFSDIALSGKDNLFWLPIGQHCKECNSYKHSFRVGINLSTEPGFIKEVKMVSLKVRLSQDDNMVIRSFFFPERSELVLNDKTYELQFVDINPLKTKELYDRFSAIVPFI